MDPRSGAPPGPGTGHGDSREPPPIPDHELLRIIGRGAYGEVWLARNVMGTHRAVKIVHRDSFDSDRPYEREYSGIRRFEPISRSHESQVDILHVGRNDALGCFYYVMELADPVATGTAPSSRQGNGNQSAEHPEPEPFDPDSYTPRTVRSELKRRGRFTFEETLEISLALATALDHLGRNGLVHRDIKPANVIFVNGRPKLADIGLVTETGGPMSFVGTEGYLPPEGPGTVQADIYSLGKTLYEVATGRDRLEFPELPTLLGSPAEESGLFELNEILLKACHPDPLQRYPDAAELHADLVLLQAGKSIRRSRALERRLAILMKAAALFVVLASLGLGAYFYQEAQTREARRLALINQELVVREREQREIAESAARLREHQRIDQFLDSNRTGNALALLAREIRDNPDDAFAARRLLATLTYRNFVLPLHECRHESPITGGEVSPDARFLGVTTGTGGLIFWNLATGENVAQMQAGEFEIWSLLPKPNIAFRRDGMLAVTPAGRAAAARIWDVSGEPRLQFEIPQPPESGESWHAEFSPDGKRIVTVDHRGVARVWEAATGQLLHVLDPGLTLGMSSAVGRFTSDGRRIVTALLNPARKITTERVICVWDSKTGQLLHRLADPSYLMGAPRLWNDPIAIHPNGKQLTYMTGNGLVHVWNLDSGDVSTSHQFHDFPIGCVAWNPSGRFFATGSNDQSLRIWETTAGGDIRALHSQRLPGFVTSAAFSPNGELLASGTRDEVVQLWRVGNGEASAEPVQHPGPVRHLIFSPDAKRLVSFGDQSAWIWDIRPGAAQPIEIVVNAAGFQNSILAQVRYTPDGSHLMTGTTDYVGSGQAYGFPATPNPLLRPGPRVQTWNASSGEPLADPSRSTVEADAGGTNQTLPASIAHRAGLRDPEFIDARDGRISDSLGRHLRVLSPDGNWAVIGRAANGTIQAPALWHFPGNQIRVELPNEPLAAAAFSPGSRFLFTISRQGQGRVFDLPSGAPTVSLRTSWFENRPNATWPGVAWSPNARWVALRDGSACRIYDATTGESSGKWMVHDGFIQSMSFSSDGSLLVTASEDQTATIWDARTGQQVVPDLLHHWLVAASTFSSNQPDVATGSWDNTARIWDRKTGLPLTDPLPHPLWVLDVAFSPDGHWLATGCRDGVARIWEVPQMDRPAPDWLAELAELLGGFRVADSGNLERIADPRKLLAAADRNPIGTIRPEDPCATWRKWFFADRETRTVSSTASTDMVSHNARLASMHPPGDPTPAEQLLELSPMDADHLSSLAFELVFASSRTRLSGLERADWLSRLALERDPALARAWWVRAEVLRAAGHHEEADRSLAESLRLDPLDPHAWLIRAMLRDQAGDETGSDEALHHAVRLAATWNNRSETPGSPRLEPLLAWLARTEDTVPFDAKALGEYLEFCKVSDRTEPFFLVGAWLSARARER